MENLLNKMRKINQLLQRTVLDPSSVLPYNSMCIELGDIIDTNVYIISTDGELLGFYERHNVNNGRVKQFLQERQFPKEYTDMVDMQPSTRANIPVENDLTVFPVELREKYPTGLTTIVPMFGAGKRLGTMILGRQEREFDSDDLVLAEYSSTVVGMQVLYQESKKIEDQVRKQTAIQMAVGTLSHSELKAVKGILEALNGLEGRLTASQIADEQKITRSVIVNALRKLASAGIIESRSLGMKGTYLKVINPGIITELSHYHFADF